MNTNTLLIALLVLAGIALALFNQKNNVSSSLSEEAKAKLRQDLEDELKAKAARQIAEAAKEAELLREKVRLEVEAMKKDAELKSKDLALAARAEIEKQLSERQNTLAAQEKRALQKEETLDKKTQSLEQKEKDIEIEREKRQQENERLATLKQDAKQLVEQQQKKLESIANLTREDARKELMDQLEHDAKMDASKIVRRIEEEATEEAQKKARWAIGAAIQRIASDVVTETAVGSIQLASDDLKGRIIGKEGRNIRALEKATGCDLIVDETPETIVVSSFDPIRREVARQAVEILLADGRIHPARIEEVVEKVKVDLDIKMKEIGEAAAIELGFPDVHPKLHKLLGRLNYRHSYGQNVLEHTKEVAHIAEYMAGEMGADPVLARRAGLFHDIGKAVDREVEGTHIELGMQLLQRYGEKEGVIHAMSCHHGDFEPRTVEAMLITAADALSAARPGARREMLSTYVKRLEQLEVIANSYQGVQKSFALQAGREIRIMVDAGKVNDDQAFWIAKDVSKRIENEMQFPGQIKVTVMRETRAVEFAR
ncbi:ribonuclease Y [Acidobacteriota bacterium]|nr:ribonuclease Y [Acidobacteriota bacterium]